MFFTATSRFAWLAWFTYYSFSMIAKSESFVYSGHLYTAWSFEKPFCTPTPTEMIGACVLLSLIKLSFLSRIGSFPGVKLEANMFDCCSTA
jgi:hypothetical protein